jgi:hypothetical protein
VDLGDYVIKSEDDKNVVLYKRMITEKGKNVGTEYLKPMGYYSNVRAALRRYCDIELNNALDTAGTLLQKYDELMHKIDGVTK